MPLATLLAITVNTALVTEKVTASELAAACSTDPGGDLCRAFIVSGANALQDPRGSFRLICIRQDAYEPFRQTFLTYATTHPDEADRPAVLVITEAYESAFPCAPMP